jgi:hypothetical protein
MCRFGVAGVVLLVGGLAEPTRSMRGWLIHDVRQRRISARELAGHTSLTGILRISPHLRLSVSGRRVPVLTPYRARRRLGSQQAQPDVAAISAAATSATVLRIPSVMIFAIFCKRAFFVAFIGVSFAIASCWSSWLTPLIMMLQLNATRNSNASPGNAGLSLPTVRPYYWAASVLEEDLDGLFFAFIVADLAGRILIQACGSQPQTAALMDNWINGLVRERARATPLHLDFSLVPGLGPLSGLELGLGFPLDPCSVLAAGLPFGLLRGDALCGLVRPGEELIQPCRPVV